MLAKKQASSPGLQTQASLRRPEAPVLVSGPSFAFLCKHSEKHYFPVNSDPTRALPGLLPSLLPLFQGLLRHLCFPAMAVLFS